MIQELNVSQVFSTAMLLARQRQSVICEQWKTISWSVGALLPNSLFPVHIQRDGQLDALIRCLEDEFSKDRSDDLFQADNMMFLANYWIGSVYEVFRLLRDRKLVEGELFDKILKSFELIRIPMEKHEIAKDRVLSKPLDLRRIPANDSTNDSFTYDPKDNKRTHIMPMSVSDRGSPMWMVTDVKLNNSYWIERRNLSDQIISLWGKTR